jgi:phospholipase C
MTRRAPDHSDFLKRGELADGAELERAMAEDPEGTLRRREFLGRTAAAAGAASLAGLLPAEQLVAAAAKKKGGRGKLPSPRDMPIDTFVVLMMENRSFDHYFGWHPDADAKNTGLSYPDALGNPVPTYRLTPDFQGCDFRDPDHGWVGGRPATPTWTAPTSSPPATT